MNNTVADSCNCGQSVKSPTLSVVLPIYQEADIIHDILINLLDVLTKSNVTFEVIAVEDGSTDGTADILQALKSQYAGVLFVVQHPYNKGNGAAIKTGIKMARGDIIACMDADGQHNPQDLLRMLPFMHEYDLVVGARTNKYKGSWFRNFANQFYNRLASWLTQFKIEDLTSGFRLFRASVVKRYVHLFPARFSYPTTSTLAFIKGGHNVKYVDIEVNVRQGSSSKIRIFRDGWRFLLLIFKIIVLFEPLKLFLPAAMALFCLGIFSTVYSSCVLGRLYIPNSGVFLFVVSIVVLLLAFIAEQIAALQIIATEKRDI